MLTFEGAPVMGAAYIVEKLAVRENIQIQRVD